MSIVTWPINILGGSLFQLGILFRSPKTCADGVKTTSEPKQIATFYYENKIENDLKEKKTLDGNYT